MDLQKDMFLKRGVWAWPRISVVITLLRAAFVAYAGSVVASAQGNNAIRSVWDGVYSEEQAARGKNLFINNCSSCHMEDLRGHQDAPALVGDDFLGEWTDQSVDDLSNRIRTSMPQDNPSSLSGQAYIDIVAFLLQSNKFPVGKEELEQERDVLKTITIKKEQ